MADTYDVVIIGGGALVEGHNNIGPNLLLGGNNILGGKTQLGSIQVRLKSNAIVIDFAHTGFDLIDFLVSQRVKETSNTVHVLVKIFEF